MIVSIAEKLTMYSYVSDGYYVKVPHMVFHCTVWWLLNW